MSKNNIRVLQLIDTLNPGGAERMAVNFANALMEEVEASYLCCTRKEGQLKEELKPEVGYLFAEKNHRLDLKALLKVKNFIKKDRINLVHAHGTSWFMGVLLKLLGCNVKLVWHDHYGESELLAERDIRILKPLSRYFDGIISVNEDLKTWAVKRLEHHKVIQLNNFVLPGSTGNNNFIKLKGEQQDFKLICVANLRPQKDHNNLLKAFKEFSGQAVSLHLIGEDPETEYSAGLLEKIREAGLKVFYYGRQAEVPAFLAQADLGILSSRSEGLPLALLEYAMAGLPVVCTKVGECKEVTGDKALLVPPGDPEALAGAIKEYYLNSKKRKFHGFELQQRICDTYSREAVLTKLLIFYAKLSRN